MAIDQMVRGLLMRALGATLPRPGAGSLANVRRVLVLRHDAIGDMLSSLGVIRALALHGLRVDVLASPANAPVLAENPWGVTVHVTGTGIRARRALGRTLAARQYDAVVDGLVLKPSVNSRTARLLRASRAPVRVGTGGRVHDFLYSHPVATDLTANHVQVLAALLGPFGIAPEEALAPVAMPLAEGERSVAESWWSAQGAGPRLLVNLSASSSERRWPDERFRLVLQQLRADSPTLRVAVSGNPPDWAAAAAIATSVGGGAFTGSLRAAFAVLAASDAVLTPDTSVAHAAAGFGVPSVVLTPRGNLRFAPWRSPARLVVAQGRGVESIGVDAVTAALLDTLKQWATR